MDLLCVQCNCLYIKLIADRHVTVMITCQEAMKIKVR